MEQTAQQAITELFDRYERETNAGLAGIPDQAALNDLYDAAYISASPAEVVAGEKDDAFAKALAAGLTRNREIGAQRMEIIGLGIEPIDTMHALARVDWRATYRQRDRQVSIDFTNVYLTRIIDGKATVFGWIIGDEEAELRKHGLI